MIFQKILISFLIIFALGQNCFAEETNKKVSFLDNEKIEIKKIKNINQENFTDRVILQGLNKVTAKTFELEGEMDNIINFERLIIKPLKCWKAPPTERPENKVLLKIYEKKLDQKEVLIFYGWMFSSSPGLSGLEHPTYDITIKECEEKIGVDENNLKE
jgi:hypothetical protein